MSRHELDDGTLANEFGVLGLGGGHPERGGGPGPRDRAGGRRGGGGDGVRDMTANGDDGGDLEESGMDEGALDFARLSSVRSMRGANRGGSRRPSNDRRGPAALDDHGLGRPELGPSGRDPNPQTPGQGGRGQGRQPQQDGGRRTFTAHQRDRRYQMTTAGARSAIDQRVSALVSRLRNRSIDPTEFEDSVDNVLDEFSGGGGMGGPMAAPFGSGYPGAYGLYGPVDNGSSHRPRYRTRELDNGCMIM